MIREPDLFETVGILARAMPENTFTEPDDDWTPVMFFNGKKKDGMMPLAPYMGTDLEKDFLGEFIMPMAIRECQATLVVMVMSTWTSKASADAMTRGEGYVRPGEQPDREEYLFLIELTREGVQRTSFAKILRSETEVPRLGEWEEWGDGESKFSGRFVEPVVAALKQVRA